MKNIFSYLKRKYIDQRPPELGRIQLIWRKEYDCGDEIIDNQHRQLFSIGNKLVNALLSREPKEDIEFLIDEFVTHIIDHFNTEEEMMRRSCDPNVDQHREIHHKLLDRAIQLNHRYKERDENKIVRDLVSFISYDVVVQHLIHEEPKLHE